MQKKVIKEVIYKATPDKYKKQSLTSSPFSPQKQDQPGVQYVVKT
jgi:hypothetical protein